ncbi:hypothetical protein, partial [Neoroseomonas soli]
MPRFFLASATILALAMAAGPASAQKGGLERPAGLDLSTGTLGADGAAAIGAGLRLFPAPGATASPPAPVVMPVPAPAPPAAILP